MPARVRGFLGRLQYAASSAGESLGDSLSEAFSGNSFAKGEQSSSSAGESPMEESPGEKGAKASPVRASPGPSSHGTPACGSVHLDVAASASDDSEGTVYMDEQFGVEAVRWP